MRSGALDRSQPARTRAPKIQKDGRGKRIAVDLRRVDGGRSVAVHAHDHLRPAGPDAQLVLRGRTGRPIRMRVPYAHDLVAAGPGIALGSDDRARIQLEAFMRPARL